MRVAVIGAGISGLSCARVLADAGLSVVVFDKGRGPGGRMSTRRTEIGLHFDHGCQYFSASDDRFLRATQRWVAAGVINVWNGRVIELDRGQVSERTKSSHRFVGVPGMSAVCKHLARELEVRAGSRVNSLRKDNTGWWVVDSNGEEEHFDAAIVSVPAPQAVPLLKDAHNLAEQASQAVIAPCWAVMAAFPEKMAFAADAAFVHNSPISWISRNSSKPQRTSNAHCWVIHANAEWSAENIEQTADLVAKRLLDEFFKSLTVPPTVPIHVAAHRWRFASPSQPLKSGCLFDVDLLIGACGDWCLGNRVEAAFLSGLEAAKQLLSCAGSETAIDA